MSYRFGKLWHLAIIWAIRKSFQCLLQGVRFLLAKQTRLSGTSNNESYLIFPNSRQEIHMITTDYQMKWISSWNELQCPFSQMPKLIKYSVGLALNNALDFIYQISHLHIEFELFQIQTSKNWLNNISHSPSQNLIDKKLFFKLYVNIQASYQVRRKLVVSTSERNCESLKAQ